MKSLIFLLLIFAATAATAAVDSPPAPPKPLRELLQEALFEEEANRDLEKAAAAYAELIAAYDQQRAFAATALFRLAEIRAKEGKKEEAIALHKRLVAEFPNQEELTKLSREKLAALGDEAPPTASPVPQPSGEDQELASVTELIAKSPDLATSRLSTAAANGYAKVAAFLLDHGANINGNPGETPPPLLYAAEKGNRAVVELLLSRGANVDVQNYRKATPLLAACKEGNLEIARLLLAHKANPNLVASPDPNAPSTALGCAVNSARVDLATLLLDHGADPDLSPAYPGYSPLGLAVSRGYEQIGALLLDGGAKIDLKGPSGATPLMIAVQSAPGLVPFLLDHGAKLDERGSDGVSILSVAMNANRGSVNLLLDRGANPNVVEPPVGFTPLHYATGFSLELVEDLLKHGANPNAKSSEVARGRTPLHTCVWSFFSDENSQRRIRLIRGGGAPPSEPKMEEQAKAICAALLKGGADINARDAEGRTALSYCENAPEDFISWFISQGADLRAKDESGRLPLDYIKPELALKLEAAKMYAELAEANAVQVRIIETHKRGEPILEIPRDSESANPPTAAAILRRAFGPARGVPQDFDIVVFRRGEDGKFAEASRTPVRLGQPARENPAQVEDSAATPKALPNIQWGDVVVICQTSPKEKLFRPYELLDQWLREHGLPEDKKE